MPRSAWLLSTALTGAALLAPPLPSMGLGIGGAEAAQGHDTRKKVNGRWVTGRFRDRSGGAAPESAPAAETRAADAPAPAAAATPAAGPSRRVRFTERKGLAKGLAKTRYSSLPTMKAKVVLKTEPATAAAVAVPLPPPAPIAQVAPAKPAVPRAADLPPDRVLSTASINPAPVVQPGAERMRSALEAKARTMASQVGTVAVPLPDPAPVVRLSARSVTYDMAGGTRTVVFDDGATVTAPFERGRAETLTGLPASR